MQKYTIVTVAHQTDFDSLCFQARSFSKYMPPSMIDQIIVIENPAFIEEEKLLNHYGELRQYVTIIDAPSIAPPETFKRSGWWSQQVLKLLIAEYVETPRYLVLDAKNVLVYPLKSKFLKNWRGRPRSFHVDYTTHTSMRWLRNTLAYFKLPEHHAKAFMPTTTPFVLETDLVRDLINYIEHREHASLSDAFYKHNLTEFFLYTGYLISTKKMAYDFHGEECKTVWDRLHDDDYVRNIIEQTEENQLPFFSVHRRAVPLLSPTARRMIDEFWMRRGLD